MTRNLLLATLFALSSTLTHAAADRFGVVVTQEGTGARPDVQDTIVLHYTGRFKDGTVFDSSHKRNEPATFRLSQVIPCFTQAFPQLQTGAKATLTCPPEIAYGESGVPGVIPPNSTLYFDVELIEVIPFAAPK